MKKKILLIICSLFILLEVKANTVIATTSGDWTTPGTWQGGVVPADFDTVVINPGVTVTFSGTNLVQKIPYIKINGTLEFTAAYFIFNSPVNIDVENGGILHDNTTNASKAFVFHFAADSTQGDTVIILSGGQFLTKASPGTKLVSFNGTVHGDTVLVLNLTGPDTIFVDKNNGAIRVHSILPVSLYNFRGQYQDGAILLKWNTASEQNNDHFEVQRSIDGNLFTSIANVAGAGTSSQQHDYSYTDGGVTKMGTNQLFYRLKQVDIDGRFTFYNMIRVLLKNDIAATLKLWPNPNSGEFILQLGQAPKQPVSIKIFDAQGRLVLQQKSQQQQININLSGKGKGMYFIQLHAADGGKKVLSALVQ